MDAGSHKRRLQRVLAVKGDTGGSEEAAEDTGHDGAGVATEAAANDDGNYREYWTLHNTLNSEDTGSYGRRRTFQGTLDRMLHRMLHSKQDVKSTLDAVLETED